MSIIIWERRTIAWNAYWDSRSGQTSSGIRIYEPSLKRLEKNGRFLVPIQKVSDSSLAIFTFQPWQSPTAFTQPCRRWIIFHLQISFPQSKRRKPFTTLLLVSWQMFVPPVQTFTDRTIHVQGLTHQHSHRILLETRKFHLDWFPKIYYFMEHTPKTMLHTIWTALSLGSTVIYHTYLHNIHF